MPHFDATTSSLINDNNHVIDHGEGRGISPALFRGSYVPASTENASVITDIEADRRL
jgi:hypothetical protein